MKLIRPFRALRPRQDLASQVASHPYDVLNRQEAHAIASENPLSFLHINKPEVDVDETIGVYEAAVYQKGADNLQRFISDGILERDSSPRYYVYRQVMGEHAQVGIVAVASLEAYEQGAIKKHEFTRPAKEDDRVAHMDALNAQVGPVFLTYRAQAEVDELVKGVTQTEPESDFEADDGTRHTFWVVWDDAVGQAIAEAFSAVDCLYVADGHHRSAAAARVRALRRARNSSHSGEESYNYFLVVVFPDRQMQILDYNRIVKDLNGMSEAEFIAALGASFEIGESVGSGAAKPVQERQFGLYVGGRWLKLRVREQLLDRLDLSDPVQSLDVTIMQNAILTPLLGIEDQRTDSRIDFVGGIRGLQELASRVDSGAWQAAIALYPTSIESLMAIADAGEVMPPKTTWFEPKLKSGLAVHVLD